MNDQRNREGICIPRGQISPAQLDFIRVLDEQPESTWILTERDPYSTAIAFTTMEVLDGWSRRHGFQPFVATGWIAPNGRVDWTSGATPLGWC